MRGQQPADTPVIERLRARNIQQELVQIVLIRADPCAFAVVANLIERMFPLAENPMPEGQAFEKFTLGWIILVENMPRGRWIGLRPGYFGALQDAVEDKFERIKGDDGLTKINPVPRKVHRFPHEVWRSSTPPEEGVLYPPEVNRDVREKARVA